MKPTTACLILLLPAFLAGCETLTPAECATANWRQLGVQDGARGSNDRAASYYESCSKARIPVDVAGYRAGRTEGLQTYCQLGNAITEGLAGRTYGDVCPPPIGQSFKSIHQVAWREQNARKNLERLQREQQKLQTELEDNKTAADRKVTIRDLLTRSDRQTRDARDELRSSQYQLDSVRNDLRRQGIY
jgi:hypothetical protein